MARNSFETAETVGDRLENVVGPGVSQDVQLFDLVLTSSARLLALTGDVAYRDSYFMKLEPLEEPRFGSISTRFTFKKA